MLRIHLLMLAATTALTSTPLHALSATIDTSAKSTTGQVTDNALRAPVTPSDADDAGASTPAAIDLREDVAADLKSLGATLNDSTARQEQRDEAARRLVSRHTDAAMQMLHSALVDEGNIRSQLAAARALSLDARPGDQFIDPLFSLLGSDKTLADAAAQALTNYRIDPGVLSRLIKRAQDPNENLTARLAAVGAIGAFADKTAAAALVGLYSQADALAAVKIAASDALANLTGRTPADPAPVSWDKWWSENSGKTGAEFKASITAARAGRYARQANERERLVDDLQSILREQYRVAASKSDTLLRYLRSNAPEIRLVGAQLILQDLQNAVPPSAATRDQLRHMIGDSSTEVRLQVARTLSAINDSAALEPLVVQLAQEPDAEVRAALILAIQPIGDLRAVPELIKMLRDPSPAVAEAASQAVQEVGARLRTEKPELAQQASEALVRIITIGTAPGDSGLRAAAAEALGPLRAPGLLRLLAPLLKSTETVAVRRAALNALGDLGDPRSQDLIVLNALDDPNREVRLAAVNALETTATFASAEPLYNHLHDPDERVSTATWRVLEKLFPSFPADVLYNWQDRFSDQPARLLVVQNVLAAMYEKAGDQDRLARIRQNQGKTLMDLKRPADAATYFGKALDHWIAAKQNMLTQGLIRQNMGALLASKQYTAAVDFAADMIRRGLSDQQTMGPLIRDEASRLYEASDDAAANQLIAAAGKMNPPLDVFFRDSLRDIQGMIKSRAAKTPAPATAPQTTAN